MSPQLTSQPQSVIVDAVVLEIGRVARAPLPYRMDGQWIGLLNKLPLLRQLPTADALQDAAAQVLAVRAAIEEAADRVKSKSDDKALAHNGDRDFAATKHQAMRLLLGLDPETQKKSAAARQELASRLLGHRGSRYVREVQVRRELLHDLAKELIEKLPETIVIEDPQRSSPLAVFPGQTEVRRWLSKYIKDRKPPKARFLLASGAASTDVFSALREVGADITILLCHPDSTITAAQRVRTEFSIREIRTFQFDGYDKLSIFLYRAPASVRGWHIGDLVGLSWYTYRDDPGKGAGHPDFIDLGGHDNLVIVSHTQTGPGKQLAAWFDRESAALLESRLTVNESDYYKQIYGSST